MKKTPLLFFFFVLFCFSFKTVSTQTNTTLKNSFVISGLLDLSKLEFIKQAIEKTDFEKYRAKTKSVYLEFRNNFTLELISADRLNQSGIQINTSNYTDVLSPEFRYPLFKIDDSGIIVTMYKTKITKEELNNNSK